MQAIYSTKYLPTLYKYSAIMAFGSAALDGSLWQPNN